MNTWIIGSSLIRNAFVRARASPEGINLGLSRIGMNILWQGYGGLTVGDIMTKVRNLARVEDPPNYIMLHVGGNDLGTAKVGDLRSDIKLIVRMILNRFPNVKIIWSEILPRINWRFAKNPEAIDKARKRLNSSIGAYVVRKGGHYLRYDDIQADYNYLRADGVHLSDMANDIFLNTLQGALELFVLYRIPKFPC